MRKKNINHKYLNNDMIVIDVYRCKKCKCLKLVDEYDVNEFNAKYLNKKCRKCKILYKKYKNEDEDDFIII